MAILARTNFPVVMELTLPPPLAEHLSKQDTALHRAVGLFAGEEATLAQAAEVAGISQKDFMRELCRRQIPIHYGSEELTADLGTVAFLAGQ